MQLDTDRKGMLVAGLCFVHCVAGPALLAFAGMPSLGSVLDQTGAAVQRAEVRIHNPVTGYTQSALSGTDGGFQLVNIPPNQYHLDIKASGFTLYSQEVTYAIHCRFN